MVAGTMAQRPVPRPVVDVPVPACCSTSEAEPQALAAADRAQTGLGIDLPGRWCSGPRLAAGRAGHALPPGVQPVHEAAEPVNSLLEREPG